MPLIEYDLYHRNLNISRECGERRSDPKGRKQAASLEDNCET